MFDDFINSKTIFKDKNALTIKYTPENIPHRDDQINTLGSILAPALKGDRPSNIFIYGITGTGKTLITHYVVNQLKTAASANDVHIHFLYVNCKMKRVADTEYRLIAYLAGELGKDVPPTGLPTDQVYKVFFEALESKPGIVILVIDEIDALVQKVGDDILYTLTRINQDIDESKVTIIGISNNLSFTDHLDVRVKSSLSDEELIFPPYNAMQLKDILKERSDLAFESEVIGPGVIEKCSALAAQEHGDARRALNLLRVAGELAERENKESIDEGYVDSAESKIDMDHIIEAVKLQPKQSKILILSIIKLTDKESDYIYTGDVYDKYVKYCDRIGLTPLTQRRISDLISELDMLGIIDTKVISRGRHGRTRTIRIALTEKLFNKVLDYLKNEFML